jgi:hypothetical protein
MRFAAAVLLAALAVAGCGGDDDESASGNEPADPRCEAATSALMTPLSNSLTNERDRLTNGWVVKSADHEDIYFVSAELDGPGYQREGDIATFATNSPGGARAIFSVNDLAKDVSNVRDGTAIAGLSMEDDGADESFECAGG